MIPIQNIYYMLSYAFQVLNEQRYKNVATEHFENVADLCAAILIKGLSKQLKRGLMKDYIPKREPLTALRGKMEISETLKTNSIIKRQVLCSYDEFSETAYMNRIIKTTMLRLMVADVDKSRKKEMKKLLVFLSNVEPLPIYSINWNLRYDRNNQTYRMLISVCYLVLKGLPQTQSDGTTKLMDFLDEQRMHRLYEKFILEYFRKEHPELTVGAPQILWQLDDDFCDMLPVMQSDIVLEKDDNILIIDAKYYAHTTQQRFNKATVHSANLYQIFTYVKNKQEELKDRQVTVSGMLLYAKTDEQIVPDNTYQMSGNQISVKTLDLNCGFDEIREQLDSIITTEVIYDRI
mgnify:FL=1